MSGAMRDNPNIPTTWTQVTVYQQGHEAIVKKPLMGLTTNTTRQHPLSDPLREKDIVRVRV
ncbi:hypothetical protein K0M31_019722 [Melipona bicolor]|uniref:Uncharacterized protein n=1 Tax=Melipona bicolor TaxID=60889 RepID=A0AA40G301_9HYME|nr:hypothetical protein K0M31_019722 [Melipona bicolor]